MAALSNVDSCQIRDITVSSANLCVVESLQCAICKTGEWEKLIKDEDIDQNFTVIGAFQSPPIHFAGKPRIIAVHNVCALLAIKADFVESVFYDGQELIFKISKKVLFMGGPFHKNHYKCRLVTYEKIIQHMINKDLDNELVTAARKVLNVFTSNQISSHIRHAKPKNFEAFKNVLKNLREGI